MKRLREGIKTHRKTLTWAVVLTVLASLFVCAVASFVALFPGFFSMQMNFRRDRELLETVVSYLDGLEYEIASIDLSDFGREPRPENPFWYRAMNAGYTEPSAISGRPGHKVVNRVKVSDDDIIALFGKLRLLGYSRISMDAGAVSFQKLTLFSPIWGAVYSLDGTEPDEGNIQFLVELKPLPGADGWYYYVDDFREWKRLNGY